MTSVAAVGGHARTPDPFRQRGRLPLLICLYTAAVAGVAAIIVIGVLAVGAEGISLAVVYAVLPVPVLIALYVWLDAYEPEPRRYLAAAFVWGAVGSVGLALGLGLAIDAIFGEVSRSTGAVVVAPLTEEPAKAVILALAFLRQRKVIDGIVDGAVYAGLTALGFAFTENILYYASAYHSMTDLPGALGATGTFFARGIGTPLAHPLFTTWIGIGIAMAVLSRKRLARITLPIAGLVLAMGAHSGWNASAVSGSGGLTLTAYGIGMLSLTGLSIWVLLARRNEGRRLWDALTDMSKRQGWFHIDEVPYLARFGLRKRARSYAKRTRGQDAMKAVKTYQQTATRMAFLYDGVMRGRPKKHAVAQVNAMRGELAVLRPSIVLPPPVRIVKRLPRPIPYRVMGYAPYQSAPPPWNQPGVPPPHGQQVPPYPQAPTPPGPPYGHR